MKIEPERRLRLLRRLLILTGLVVPILVAYVFIYLWHRPTAGIAVYRNNYATVAEVIPGGPAAEAGLQAGDVLLTIDGIPWTGRFGSQVGQTIVVEIDRDGQRLRLSMPVTRLLQLEPWPTTVVACISLFTWCAATILLRHRLDRPEVRLLFLLAQMAAVYVLGSLDHSTPLPPWLWHLSTICVGLAIPLFLHFHLTFPVQLGTRRRRRWALGSIYGLAPLLIAAGLSYHKLWAPLANLCALLEVVAAVAVAVYVYLRRATADDRRRQRLIVSGTVLGLIPPILIYSIPRMLQGSSLFGVPNWLATSCVVIVPVSYLVAIVRHNLFGIDRLLNRTLVYGLLSLGIFALYLGPFLALVRFAPDAPLLQTATVAGLTLLVGLGFNWTRERVQRLVDRLFYGGWYDYPGVVEIVSDALAHSLDREHLANVLTRQVAGLMQLQEGQLWLGNPGPASAEKPPPPQVQFPLTFEGRVHGLWTVGARRDGEDFSTADRRILQTLARQAEIGLSNVLLVETLRQQLEEIRQTQHRLLRSREEERARLARELHDGPIQTLVGLNIQMGLLLAPPKDADAPLQEELAAMRAEVRILLDELRQVCTELRPPMLDTMGLGAALRSLAEDWSAQNDIQAVVDVPADTALRVLPDEVTINLFRVAQEALTNVARHAQAQKVAIRLAWEHPHLSLTVQDDGRGLTASAAPHDLAATGHFGLAGMQERVGLFGGSLTLDSIPGRGTTVRVAWKAPTSEAS